MHLPNKYSVLNAVYLPIIMIKNQLLSLFIVVLSYQADYQILAFLLVLLVFTIYSLIYCPYRPLLRVFFHLSQLAFIIQVIIIYLLTKNSYGGFDQTIINVSGAEYKLAWVLLSLNFLQITLYALLSLAIVFSLISNFACNKKIQNNV